MTAEIAIMNKTAIALAADSAVTIVGSKVYNTVNKLFMLSKYQPVGIMIYGNAQLMGVPWESIIKIYRKNLAKQKFNTLTEYASHFISYLDQANSLFPESEQAKHYRASVVSYFNVIKCEIDEKIKSAISSECGLTEKQIKKLISGVIKKHFDEWQHLDKLPHLPKRYSADVLNNFKKDIRATKKEIFEALPISKEDEKKLEVISSLLPFKNHFSFNTSGIVVAGFGEADIFPSLVSYLVEDVVLNRLKYKLDKEAKINFNNSAAIIPFAQSEMVYAFMEGIDPSYHVSLDGFLTGFFKEYPRYIVAAITQLNDSEKEELEKKLQQASHNLLQEFKKWTKSYRNERHIAPIVNAVSALPKDELSAMAESLVNLTSFKRKISLEIETVGGPIDVAVISKGDGFVWIKRKHYFDPKLNHHFISNYYNDVNEGVCNDG